MRLLTRFVIWSHTSTTSSRLSFYISEMGKKLPVNNVIFPSSCCNGSKAGALAALHFLSWFLYCTLYTLSLSMPFYRQQWCRSSSSSSTKVAAHGLHHFVNGWCNYHWQWQPSLLRVGCTSHCPLMANPNIVMKSVVIKSYPSTIVNSWDITASLHVLKSEGL